MIPTDNVILCTQLFKDIKYSFPNLVQGSEINILSAIKQITQMKDILNFVFFNIRKQLFLKEPNKVFVYNSGITFESKVTIIQDNRFTHSGNPHLESSSFYLFFYLREAYPFFLLLVHRYQMHL